MGTFCELNLCHGMLCENGGTCINGRYVLEVEDFSTHDCSCLDFVNNLSFWSDVSAFSLGLDFGAHSHVQRILVLRNHVTVNVTAKSPASTKKDTCASAMMGVTSAGTALFVGFTIRKVPCPVLRVFECNVF